MFPWSWVGERTDDGRCTLGTCNNKTTLDRGRVDGTRRQFLGAKLQSTPENHWHPPGERRAASGLRSGSIHPVPAGVLSLHYLYCSSSLRFHRNCIHPPRIPSPGSHYPPLSCPAGRFGSVFVVCAPAVLLRDSRCAAICTLQHLHSPFSWLHGQILALSPSFPSLFPSTAARQCNQAESAQYLRNSHGTENLASFHLTSPANLEPNLSPIFP
ncbi:hypothetical protein QBC45DRAFT_100954 [Copromyces sp. CBS 386.78]|nr:hypothetical protein QBC45DRAFT_100954 [Copromyces sp. CBS 386.78]